MADKRKRTTAVEVKKKAKRQVTKDKLIKWQRKYERDYQSMG